MREGVLTFRARYVNIKNNVEIRGILSKNRGYKLL